jgi:hypothetical protein
MATKGITYCEECGQASGFTGGNPPVLAHATFCISKAQDHVMWDEQDLDTDWEQE